MQHPSTIKGVLTRAALLKMSTSNTDLARLLVATRGKIIPGGSKRVADDSRFSDTLITADANAAYNERMSRMNRWPVKKRAKRDVWVDMIEPTDEATSKKDWKDMELGRRPIYRFVHETAYAEGNEIYYGYVLRVYRSFFTKMTTRTVVMLLELAFNLRDHEDVVLFNPVKSKFCDSLNEKEIGNFSNATLHSAYSKARVETLIPDDNDEDRKRIITSICFIAASFIRVATQSAENYTKIHAHIARNFKSFYKYELAVSHYAPTLEMMQSFKLCLTNDETVNHMLYTLMYAGEENTRGLNIKDFLYRIHTRHTGMHAYMLFRDVAREYNLKCSDLADYLDTKMFRPALLELKELFQKCVNNKKEPLGMWKYARIFDHSFFTGLQTKNCALFVAVLCNMLNNIVSQNPNRRGDVMKIVQVANLPKYAKDFASVYSKRATMILTTL